MPENRYRYGSTLPLADRYPGNAPRPRAFIPFDKDLAAKTAESITHLGCRLALCDIAPMGMAIAHQAGIPSVLIENVTWDWIYQGYRSEFFHPDLIADEMAGFIL